MQGAPGATFWAIFGPKPVFGVGWVSAWALCVGYVAILISPHYGDPEKARVM